jgi:ABC-type enterobactin transport system permease subunit
VPARVAKVPARVAKAAAPVAKAAVAAPEIAQRLRASERLTSTLARAANACGYQLDDLEAAARG